MELKYAGMEISDAKRLRLLENEPDKLKKLVTDQVINKGAALKKI